MRSELLFTSDYTCDDFAVWYTFQMQYFPLFIFSSWFNALDKRALSEESIGKRCAYPELAKTLQDETDDKRIACRRSHSYELIVSVSSESTAAAVRVGLTI
ncbi:hypothetical protein TNIN_224851 [Trichonephila inaurata madagascariensis]|uniref:Uncharacterized protein n=1 Tax=Trichonephila inaurata madagascariensis TaxID=2747483 RepID=A0A8X7BTR3_9ARAC|nr:hypothetical protein TNIN_224851 [Trichonephila inaurata madagascariensis]